MHSLIGIDCGTFTEMFDAVQAEHHSVMTQKGFWANGLPNEAEKIALMHEELSEALRAIRHGNPPDDKIPQFSGVEAELADTILRIMDYAQYNRLDVSGAILAKLDYNRSRPHKHGKLF